jgi:imidazolonepropionase-like amidohydrolase
MECVMKAITIVFLCCLFTAAAMAADTYVLRGATVHPVSGPDIPNGMVVISDGKIADVGAKVAIPKGAKIVELKGLHVYPGMIDSATQIGLIETNSVRESNDSSENRDYVPEVRAIVAVNPASEYIPVGRASGITSVITAPQGGVLSGQAALMHMDGWTWEEMAILPSAAMMLQFPALGGGRGRGGFGGGPAGMQRTSFAEQRRQFEERIKAIHAYFDAARRYEKAKAMGGPAFERDPQYEAMLPVLAGKLPLAVRASDSRAIKAAIEFADQEKVKMVLIGTGESYKVAADLKAKNIPVICGPTLALPEEEDDPYDQQNTIPGELYKAGVKIAFGSFGNQFERNLPFQAANAVSYGLPYEEALKAVTLNAAEIWGVGDKLGSIDKGKIADLIITDGDPLEARTNIKQAFINGKPASLETKHTRLYKQYMERP